MCHRDGGQAMRLRWLASARVKRAWLVLRYGGWLRAQAKLRDIEDRLRKKEAALFESNGVSAVIARDRRGNVTFNFDSDEAPRHSVGAGSMNGGSKR